MVDNKIAGSLIAAFVFVIVGLVLVDVVGDQIVGATQTLTSINETLFINSSRLGGSTVNNATALDLVHDDIVSITEVLTFNGTVYTADRDYNFTRDNVYMLNSTFVNKTGTFANGNLTRWTYVYEPDTYVEGSSIARTLLTLIPIFAAIAILAWLISKVLAGSELLRKQ